MVGENGFSLRPFYGNRGEPFLILLFPLALDPFNIEMIEFVFWSSRSENLEFPVTTSCRSALQSLKRPSVKPRPPAPPWRLSPGIYCPVSFCIFPRPAECIDQPHLLDAVALNLNQLRAREDHRQRARPGNRHVQPIAAVKKLDVSRKLFTAGGHH